MVKEEKELSKEGINRRTWLTLAVGAAAGAVVGNRAPVLFKEDISPLYTNAFKPVQTSTVDDNPQLAFRREMLVTQGNETLMSGGLITCCGIIMVGESGTRLLAHLDGADYIPYSSETIKTYIDQAVRLFHPKEKIKLALIKGDWPSGKAEIAAKIHLPSETMQIPYTQILSEDILASIKKYKNVSLDFESTVTSVFAGGNSYGIDKEGKMLGPANLKSIDMRKLPNYDERNNRSNGENRILSLQFDGRNPEYRQQVNAAWKDIDSKSVVR